MEGLGLFQSRPLTGPIKNFGNGPVGPHGYTRGNDNWDTRDLLTNQNGSSEIEGDLQSRPRDEDRTDRKFDDGPVRVSRFGLGGIVGPPPGDDEELQ